MKRKNIYLSAITGLLLFFSVALSLEAGEYYVAPNGSDSTGTGSKERPWKTLPKAVRTVPDDGSTIFVEDGLYEGSLSFSRNFRKICRISAVNPYRARFSSPAKSNRVLYLTNASNIIFSGLEFFGSGATTTDYLIQLSTANTNNLRFENCIIHDSYKNDLIKINDHANRIVFRGCVFFNPTNNGGDEHFDINTVVDIMIEDSIFFKDYAGSNREAGNKGYSFIVIKNSGSTPDITKRISFKRNIFLNWSGKKDNAYILLGEDGKPFFEAQDILIENNLFLHHTENPIWGAFLYKGGLKNVLTRANTITGHPKASGFGTFSAVCLKIGKNSEQENMIFVNNIFCDNTGKMPRFSSTIEDQFADNGFTALNNLYWNNDNSITVKEQDLFAPKKDAQAVLDSPDLPDVPEEIVLPRIDSDTGKFRSGNETIREEFERLVKLYAVPGPESAAISRADPNNMPNNDILGKPRSSTPDIGCFETEK